MDPSLYAGAPSTYQQFYVKYTFHKQLVDFIFMILGNDSTWWSAMFMEKERCEVSWTRGCDKIQIDEKTLQKLANFILFAFY